MYDLLEDDTAQGCSTHKNLELGASPSFWNSPPPTRILLRSYCKSLEPLPLKISVEIYKTLTLVTLIHWSLDVIKTVDGVFNKSKKQPASQL